MKYLKSRSSLFTKRCLLMSLGAMAVQTAAEQTKFVAVSQEAILSPYLTAKSLPKTLSIDAFSEAEIATIRQQIYESIKDNVDRKVDEYRNFKRPFSRMLNVSVKARAVKRASICSKLAIFSK